MRDFQQPRLIDKDPIKIWERFKPYIQGIGYVLMGAFFLGGIYSQFNAYGATITTLGMANIDHEVRLNSLERNNAVINQKLDDMIAFLGVPHHEK